MIPVLPLWNKKISVQSKRINSQKVTTVRSPEDTHDTALVGGALAFTLRFTRFLGTAPSRFKRENGCWRISMSPAMCVYSYVFIILLNIIIFAAVIKDASVPLEMSIRMNTDTNIAVWVVDLIIVTIISLYGVVSGPSQMKHLISYLNQINMIFINMKYDYIIQKPEKWRCSFIVLYMLGVIGVCAGDIAGFKEDATKNKKSMTTSTMYTFYYFEVLILCILEIQFILSAMLSHAAFRCVNEELIALIVDIDMKTKPNCNRASFLDRGFFSSNSVTVPPYALNVIIDSGVKMDNNSYSMSQTWSEKIRRLSLAYSEICSAVRKIDNANGLLVVLLVFSFLIHMVVTPYYLIIFLFQRRDECLVQVFWCIFHTSKMMMIVEPGHRMQQEIAKTQVLVGQLMNRASSPIDPIMDELNIFHKQINLNPVVFAPLGICILSRPLIATVLGAVTTYLVILVQFQKSGYDFF